MTEEVQNGFYQDKYGRWQADRRKNGDRRASLDADRQHERRKVLRRKADRQQWERDHNLMDEALNEFAAEHGGHI